LVTIEVLRKNAELNFCPVCFEKYTALIEPSIRLFLSQPLYDFRLAESEITQIVMKTQGIFKGSIIVISIDKDEEEKMADEVDVKAFRKVEKMPFAEKIKYLHETGVLQNSSYKILDKARMARNKIHTEPIINELSLDDYHLFSMARIIATNIWGAVMTERNKEVKDKILSNIEVSAELWLKNFKTIPPKNVD
jgi:hypothetical protein